MGGAELSVRLTVLEAAPTATPSVPAATLIATAIAPNAPIAAPMATTDDISTLADIPLSLIHI
eukprot:11736103-Prorocentrum_lima.AAC.1